MGFYTPEIGVTLCEAIAGGKSVAEASAEIGIDPATVYRWFAKHPDLRDNYTRARDTRADHRFERIDQVLLDMRTGTIDAQQARVEIDTIKWQCGKEAAKRYGDRLELAGDPAAPMQSRVEIVFVDSPKEKE